MMENYQYREDGEWLTRASDGAQVHISSAEIVAWMSDGNVPTPYAPTPEFVHLQIDALESREMMKRGAREALLAYAVFIAQSAGVPETQLYAENIAYRKIKDFDAQIAALRAQL